MRGSVTLSGNLKYESQRIPLMKALRGVAGVRNVLDQLKATAEEDAARPGTGRRLTALLVTNSKIPSFV